MKALTIWPEWVLAFKVLQKDIENRCWPAPKELIGQRIALHAGRRIGGVVLPGDTGLGRSVKQRERALSHYGDVTMMGQAAGWEFEPATCIADLNNRRGLYIFHRTGKDNHGLSPLPSLFATWWYDKCPFGCIFATAKLEWSSFLDRKVNLNRPYGIKTYRNGKRAGPWSIPGQHGFRLTEYRSLKEPVPCRGAQKFWEIPEEAVARVVADRGE